MSGQFTNVVILGAGFGGVEATLNLARYYRHNDKVRITLVNERNFLLFTPLLPQIVSSYIEPRHIVQTIRDIRRDMDFEFIRDTVVAIDPVRKVVALVERELSYDYLIIALGSVTNFYKVPGAEQHSFTLKSLEDAVLLREHIIDLCEHADHENDIGIRREMLTFVVVGGGYTGVELIAEIHDFMFRYVVKKYRGILPSDIKLLLLEATDNILVGVDPDLARRARKRLRAGGIELRTNAPAMRCFDGGVEINNQTTVRTRTTVWTAGVKANPIVEAMPVHKGKAGRVVVSEYLQVPDFPDVFVIGDAAIVGASDEKSPPVAPLAMAQARTAAKNIIRSIEKQPLEPFDYTPAGYLVSLGMNEAVVDIKGFKLHGYLAWLLWNMVHLLKLVGFKKQVQVLLDWSLASWFPRDSSIIRTPQTCQLCDRGIPHKT